MKPAQTTISPALVRREAQRAGFLEPNRFLPLLALAVALPVLFASCSPVDDQAEGPNPETSLSEHANGDGGNVDVDEVFDIAYGTETYQGFTTDNVLRSETVGEVHFGLYVPEAYDGSEPYALFVTLPGYQGLYFQGVGENLRTEEFGYEAQHYNEKMIVVAPQLNDWGEASADETIALVEHMLKTYNVDPDKVYLEGYSGGGETLSIVMGKRPELFAAALHCASQWDGDLEALASAQVPVRLTVGENDEYYGSGPARNAAAALRALYEAQGLPDDEIDRLVVLDVKDAGYFTRGGVTNQHGGGGSLFSHDEDIMGWLLG